MKWKLIEFEKELCAGVVEGVAISISDFDRRLLIDLITEIDRGFYELAYQTYATDSR